MIGNTAPLFPTNIHHMYIDFRVSQIFCRVDFFGS
jgi:hypothetical protein